MGDKQLPGGYTEIDRWTLNQASVKEFLLSVLVGLVAFFAALAAAAFVVGTATDSGEVTIDGGTFFSGLLLGGVLGAILHEGVHGVFFLAFGGRPRFGFKPWTRSGPVFYAEDDLLASVVTWAFVLNVAGSAGDMLMMRKVMSYPRATRFEDTGEGFVAYGSAGSLESP